MRLGSGAFAKALPLMAICFVFAAAAAGRAASARVTVLERYDEATIAGTSLMCATMWKPSGPIAGVVCFRSGNPLIGKDFYHPRSYVVMLGVDGQAEMAKTNYQGIPNHNRVFAGPSSPEFRDIVFGGERGKRVSLGAGDGIRIGRSPVFCFVRTIAIVVASERAVLCARYTASGSPRPKSLGVSISDRVAFVIGLDASGNPSTGIKRLQPR